MRCQFLWMLKRRSRRKTEGISLEDAYAKLQASKQDHEKASENPEIAPAVPEKAVDLEQVDTDSQYVPATEVISDRVAPEKQVETARHDILLKAVTEVSQQSLDESEIPDRNLDKKAPEEDRGELAEVSDAANNRDVQIESGELAISDEHMAAESLDTGNLEAVPEEVFIPASQAQINVLKQESQIRMLQERMAQHKIPKMSPDQLSSLTQKDFAEIMKIQPRLVSDSVKPDLEDKNRGISR